MQRFTSSPLQFSLVNKKKKATKKLQMSRRDNSAEIEEEGKKTEILTREKGRKNKERVGKSCCHFAAMTQAQWISTQSPIPAPGLGEWERERVCVEANLLKYLQSRCSRMEKEGDQLEWTIYNTEKQKTGRKENGKEHTQTILVRGITIDWSVCLRLCFFSSAKLVVASECAHSGGLYTYSN